MRVFRDWSEFLQTASDAVLENLIEVEGEQILDDINYNAYFDHPTK